MSRSGDSGVPDEAVAWFLDHVPDVAGEPVFQRITGGRSNLTYRVVDDAGRTWALRRPPLGGVLETAHDMGREWRFLSALAPTEVPVPPPVAFCDDRDVAGVDFYVMDFAPGRVLNSVDDAGWVTSPEVKQRIGDSTMDVLAALHAVEPAEVGLDDLARPGNFVERQLKRWHRQAHQSAMEDLSAIDRAHQALSERVPEPPANKIAHGDFRTGNIAYLDDGSAAAVFDWELATIGDPYCDLGHILVSWSQEGDTVPAALPNPTQLGGFPTREDLIARYEQASGTKLPDIDFYIAFARWRAACIHAGVWTRYQAGDMGDAADADEVTGPEAIVAQAESALWQLGL
ncbi:phosphotransferase family protein [Actinomycetospora sp. CA-084318]|uniref:phosphotransferase family protein n=1 Tax=Actinomycetospora sp. CA-084318 TaxID=3239892 RepID=UPI003D98007E